MFMYLLFLNFFFVAFPLFLCLSIALALYLFIFFSTSSLSLSLSLYLFLSLSQLVIFAISLFRTNVSLSTNPRIHFMPCILISGNDFAVSLSSKVMRLLIVRQICLLCWSLLFIFTHWTPFLLYDPRSVSILHTTNLSIALILWWGKLLFFFLIFVQFSSYVSHFLFIGSHYFSRGSIVNFIVLSPRKIELFEPH